MHYTRTKALAYIGDVAQSYSRSIIHCSRRVSPVVADVLRDRVFYIAFVTEITSIRSASLLITISLCSLHYPKILMDFRDTFESGTPTDVYEFPSTHTQSSP